MKPILGTLLLTAALALPAAGAGASEADWLPLKKDALLRILAEGSEDAPPRVQTLEDCLAELRRADTADSRAAARREAHLQAELERLSPDTVWLVSGPGLPFQAVMAGDGERVHSLRIWVPVVNHSEAESKRTFEALSALFATVYPDWADARRWPGESLVTAWNRHPLAREEPLEDLDDVFVRHAASGITSSTFGVPPDIIVYGMTVRNRCIETRAQGNPFERMIC